MDSKPTSPDVQQGTEIPQPEIGGVADWLFNKSNYLRQLVGGVTSWLNLKVILNFQNADGTVSPISVRPAINGKNATLTLPIPVNGGGSSATSFHPFKLYQPTNFSKFTQGVTFLGNDGTPTACTIDATVPTDFTAVPPTVNPTTDAWRFWAVRTGYVEYRPRYWFSLQPAVQSANKNEVLYAPENWVYKFRVQTGTDNLWPHFDDPTTVPFFNSVLIMAGGDPDGSFPTLFSFWIDITPDTNAATAAMQIKCQRVTAFDTNINGFPDSSPNVIPIGIAQYEVSKTDTFVWQYVFDHLRGRYPAPNSAFVVGSGKKFCSGSVMNFRGYYDDPAEFADQVFYAGDIIIMNNSAIWQFLGAQGDNRPQEGTFFGGGNWILIFGS